jgi:hypothetical protein
LKEKASKGKPISTNKNNDGQVAGNGDIAGQPIQTR